jgi:hypothetical protein
MMIKQEPPAELKQAVDRINEELVKATESTTRLRLELYLEQDEWGDDWGIQLVGASPQFVMRHLRQEYLISWHLFYLIGSLVSGMREVGVQAGLDLAHTRLIGMFDTIVRKKN